VPPPDAPTPNFNRANDYKNKWSVVTGNNTAKCRICEEKLTGTKWSIKCDNCGKVICPDCWKGTRERHGEPILEGHWQNQDGCWCQHPSGTDSQYMPQIDARNSRIVEASSRGKRKASGDNDDVDASPSEARSAKRTLRGHTTQDDGLARSTFEGEDDDSLFIPTPAETSSSVACPAFSMTGTLRNMRAAGEGDAEEEEHEDEDEEDSTIIVDSSKAQPVTGKDRSQPRRTQPAAEQAEQSKFQHLEGKTTVVVGGGVIGLSIALELAKHAKETETNHKIIIVEVRETDAELASYECAGIISRYSLPDVYDSLYKISSKAWAEMLSDEVLVKKFKARPDAIQVVKRSQEATAPVPDWYKLGDDEMLQRLTRTVGRM